METLQVKKDKVPNAKQKTRKLSGSAALLEVFLSEKVETIFGYPGGAIMPIYDALYD
jgi:acetolactate synthase I/II/III large subunit